MKIRKTRPKSFVNYEEVTKGRCTYKYITTKYRVQNQLVHLRKKKTNLGGIVSHDTIYPIFVFFLRPK